MKTESMEEDFILGMVRFNKANPRLEIVKKGHVGRLHFTFEWRSRKNLCGRFGGGWNWNLGFEAGGSTIILNLLICFVRIYWKKKKGGAHECKE